MYFKCKNTRDMKTEFEKQSKGIRKLAPDLKVEDIAFIRKINDVGKFLVHFNNAHQRNTIFRKWFLLRKHMQVYIDLDLTCVHIFKDRRFKKCKAGWRLLTDFVLPMEKFLLKLFIIGKIWHSKKWNLKITKTWNNLDNNLNKTNCCNAVCGAVFPKVFPSWRFCLL